MQTIYMKYCLKFRNFSVTEMIAKCSNKLDAAIKTPLGCCKLQVTNQICHFTETQNLTKLSQSSTSCRWSSVDSKSY